MDYSSDDEDGDKMDGIMGKYNLVFILLSPVYCHV